MKPLFFFFFIGLLSSNAQDQIPSKVNFDDYEKLTNEVNLYRKNRLIDWATFNTYSKESNTIILDTRSKEMYDRKHLKGAIHLNFSDFTQENLERLIPDSNTRILIYCNNNFGDDPINFTTKSYIPSRKPQRQVFTNRSSKQALEQFPVTLIQTEPAKELTLALNIPTFINLYGYGYKNVYELSEFISVFNSKLVFEGTDIR
jgi:Rhodanese-like domain